MNKKVIRFILLILSLITLIFWQQEEEIYEPKVLAINSLYSYLYEPSRYYTISFFMDEKLKNEEFNYYLYQHETKYVIEIKEQVLIGTSKCLARTYLNYVIDFMIVEPFVYEESTYLLMENNNYNFALEVGIFYTYHSKELKYLSYEQLSAEYTDVPQAISLNTSAKIEECYISKFIKTSIEKKMKGYSIKLNYIKYLYPYKIFLLLRDKDTKYVVDCPRLKTSNLDLNDYLNYITEGIPYVKN